jgi:integrase
MLRVARQRKLLGSIPEIHCLSGQTIRERVLSHEEEAAYLDAAAQPLRDVATVMLDTGMRPEEVFRIAWEHVHFEPAGAGARFGYLHNPIGKTKYARRDVPMTIRVKAVLEMRHLAAGQPAQGWVFLASTQSGHIETVKNQHATAVKQAKLGWFVLYTLRHTMLTRLGESGAEAFLIQKIAGHSSILISQRYVHPTPERVERGFEQFEAYNDRKRKALGAARVQ